MFKLPTLRPFFIFYAIFFIFGLIVISIFPKGTEVIFLNQYATSSLDTFFKTYTELGNGILFIFPIVIALFIRYDYAIMGTISLLMTGILTYIFKQLLFKGLARPTAFFTNGELTHFIDGFEYHSYNTFPSGHTMTGFALLLFLSILCNKRWISGTALFLAVLVGISRVYLLQHFFIDIYVGAFLGIISVVIGYQISCVALANKYIGVKKGLFKK